MFLLSPDVVYLNHGSFGACPRPVFETYQAWQLELERQPVDFLRRRYNALLGEAREVLGQYLGADPDDLTYLPNASTAVNTVARSVRFSPGDEILATNHEYGAMDRVWRFIAQKTGARYIQAAVPLPVVSPTEVIDAVWSRVTPRTRLLFLSHITSPTAIILPVEELVRRAREAGILTFVDGAHAPGQIPLDLEALGADFYTGNCHKWLLAPKGAAFLYARRERQDLLEPLVVSWGWGMARGGRSRLITEHEYQGTRDIAAWLAVPAAIRFQQEHRWPGVRLACRALLGEARRRVQALTGLPPLVPDDPSWFVQMAAMELPASDPDALQSRLWREHRIEVPVIPWQGRTLLRVSIQAYNGPSDVDRLLEALERSRLSTDWPSGN